MSEGRKKVVFYITGFGPFCGVDKNPTQQFVEHLQQNLSNYESEIHTIRHTSIVEVAAVDAQTTLFELYTHTEEHKKDDEVFVWVHLGVDGTRPTFNLEQIGWNEANFRCDDMRGWRPSHQPIDNNSKLGSQRKTTLNLQKIHEKLEKKWHDKVIVSTDPGRFLCNFIFFSSLGYVKKINGNAHSLFLHVPPLSSSPSGCCFEELCLFLKDSFYEIAVSLVE